MLFVRHYYVAIWRILVTVFGELWLFLSEQTSVWVQHNKLKMITAVSLISGELKEYGWGGGDWGRGKVDFLKCFATLPISISLRKCDKVVCVTQYLWNFPEFYQWQFITICRPSSCSDLSPGNGWCVLWMGEGLAGVAIPHFTWLSRMSVSRENWQVFKFLKFSISIKTVKYGYFILKEACLIYYSKKYICLINWPLPPLLNKPQPHQTVLKK